MMPKSIPEPQSKPKSVPLIKMPGVPVGGVAIAADSGRERCNQMPPPEMLQVGDTTGVGKVALGAFPRWHSRW